MSDTFNVVIDQTPDVFNVELANNTDVFQVLIAEKGIDGAKGDKGEDGNSTDMSNYLALTGGALTGNLSAVSIYADEYLGLPTYISDDVPVSTKVRASSANWDSTYTTVQTNSANWDATYTEVLNNNTYWNDTYALVSANSPGWDSTYNTVNSNSATTWNYQGANHLPLSGGNLTGPLSSNSSAIFETLTANNATFMGTISAASYLGFSYPGSVGCAMNNGATAIPTGIKGIGVHVPWGHTLTGWSIRGTDKDGIPVDGTIVVDVWAKAWDATTPATSADTITASSLPTLSAAKGAYSTSLPGWTVSFLSGAEYTFNVDLASVFCRANIQLFYNRV